MQRPWSGRDFVRTGKHSIAGVVSGCGVYGPVLCVSLRPEAAELPALVGGSLGRADNEYAAARGGKLDGLGYVGRAAERVYAGSERAAVWIGGATLRGHGAFDGGSRSVRGNCGGLVAGRVPEVPVGTCIAGLRDSLPFRSANVLE